MLTFLVGLVVGLVIAAVAGFVAFHKFMYELWQGT